MYLTDEDLTGWSFHIQNMLRHKHLLSQWHIDFLENVDEFLYQRRFLSLKQIKILDAINEMVNKGEADAL